MSNILVNTELCKAEDLKDGDIFIYEGELHTVLDYDFSIGTIDIVVSIEHNMFTYPKGSINTVVHIPKLCDVVCLVKNVSI